MQWWFVFLLLLLCGCYGCCRRMLCLLARLLFCPLSGWLLMMKENQERWVSLSSRTVHFLVPLRKQTHTFFVDIVKSGMHSTNTKQHSGSQWQNNRAKRCHSEWPQKRSCQYVLVPLRKKKPQFFGRGTKIRTVQTQSGNQKDSLHRPEETSLQAALKKEAASTSTSYLYEKTNSIFS